MSLKVKSLDSETVNELQQLREQNLRLLGELEAEKKAKHAKERAEYDQVVGSVDQVGRGDMAVASYYTYCVNQLEKAQQRLEEVQEKDRKGKNGQQLLMRAAKRVKVYAAIEKVWHEHYTEAKRANMLTYIAEQREKRRRKRPAEAAAEAEDEEDTWQSEEEEEQPPKKRRRAERRKERKAKALQEEAIKDMYPEKDMYDIQPAL